MVSIKTIQFNNHYLFGTQTFNFCNNDNNFVYKSIVFAGENGSGKTTILDIISEYLKEDYWFWGIEGDLYSPDIFITLDISDLNYTLDDSRKITEARLSKYIDRSGIKRCKIDFPQYKITDQRKIYQNGKTVIFPFKIDLLYSKVEINYNSRDNVNSIFNDDINMIDLLSSRDIAHDVIKLLCTICILDDIEFHRYYEEHGKALDDNLSRKARFNNALTYAFENSLKYKGLENGQAYKPLFLVNGREVEIEKLSSGQKQIVFRGASLLHNINSGSGYPVLIDEPELSMHPIWEQKIYGFYKNLFMIDNNQISQMFYATHSEHLLSDAMNDESCLIVKLNNMNHVEISDNNSILPTLTLGEIKYSIFNLYTVDFHNLLYAYIGNNIVISPFIGDIDSYLVSVKNCPLKSYRGFDVKGKPHPSKSLSSYIRNCIDHPDNIHKYNDNELKESTEFMIKIIKGEV